HKMARARTLASHRCKRELRFAGRTTPLGPIFCMLWLSTEFQRIPRWGVSINPGWRTGRTLHEAGHSPTILRQVRRSGAASLQPLHPTEADGLRCYHVLYGADLVRLEREAHRRASPEHSHRSCEQPGPVQAADEVPQR